MIPINIQVLHYLLWGVVIHLICDWLLQNHWMAENKSGLRHPSAYVHSSIHFVGLLLVFPPLAALVVAVIHLLIDTRAPLAWWRKFFRQTTEGPVALHVAIWGDQVAHILVLAVAALVVAY